MNKNILPLLALGLLTLAGCTHEEEDLFSKSAAERLNESSALYSRYLEASPAGWALQYYPTTSLVSPQGRGYLMLVDFDEDNSVRVAMNNELTNGYLEDRSLWQVIADNGPVLSFNTYNRCMHTFSSPEDIPTTGENEQGTGFGGDYEFVIVDVPSDVSHIMLKGKKRGTYNLLTPLEEGTDYEAYLADVKAFSDKMFAAASPSFGVATFGSHRYKMTGASTGIPALYPYDGDPITESTFHPFLVTKRGGQYYLRFRTAIGVDDEVAQDFVYDEQNDRFVDVAHPDFIIDGDSPTRYFTSWGTDQANRWQLNRSSEMSEKMQQLYEGIYQEFRNLRLTLNNIRFSWNEGQVYCSVQYRSTSSSTANYAYSMSSDADHVTFAFEGDVGNAGNVRTAIASLNNLIEQVLPQQFAVTAATTKFDLRTIRLTSVSDPDLWFVLTLN